MNAFLLELLNMSLVASLLIAAVIIVRLVFRKAPKAIICILWALVGLRLICPFSFESKLSVVPDAEPVTYISQFDAENITEKPVYKDVVSVEASDGSVIVKTEDTTKFDFVGFIIKLAPYIWVGGILIMAASSVISYIRLRRNLLVTVNKEGNIRRCDGIKSPFILGVIKPKIYIPSYLSEEEQEVVIAHEKAHLKRLDHLWKPLGYLILTVHWFNPLVWVAYALLCRDIESACDERVVKDMSGSDKQLYSMTLLSCSAPRHMLTACPVAFGEVSVKQRVKSVLNYKKPAFWIIILAVVACVVVAVLFMTNPVKPETKVYSTETELLNRTIIKENENEYTENFFACESHEILERETYRNYITYYLLVSYGEYSCDNETVEIGGIDEYYPAVISAERTDDGKYELLEYWEPEDGEGYGDSVKEKFPAKLHDKVLRGTSYANTLQKACDKEAYEYYGVEKRVKAVGEYPRFTAEILSVNEDYYLVAPLENETIFGRSFDKIYVSRNAGYGGNVEYAYRDIITVTYSEGMEESDPPILGNINGISMRQRAVDRIETYDIDFYRLYDDGGSVQYYAYVDADESKVENLEFYRFMPKKPADDEARESGTYVDEEDFMPYIVIDRSQDFITFDYAEGYTIVGTFEETEDKLIISSAVHKGNWLNAMGESVQETETYVFNKTQGGYAFDLENSALINTYYTLGNSDEIYNSLPDGSVFTNDFIVISNFT